MLKIKTRADVAQSRSPVLLPLPTSAARADITMSTMLSDMVLNCMYFLSQNYAVYLDEK